MRTMASTREAHTAYRIGLGSLGSGMSFMRQTVKVQFSDQPSDFLDTIDRRIRFQLYDRSPPSTMQTTNNGRKEDPFLVNLTDFGSSGARVGLTTVRTS
jgi:hypothetical protein